MRVDDSLTLSEGREEYFATNGLPADGGYEDSWVVVKLGPFPVFAFPNTAGRKRDVPFHDLHHVLTGYPTTFTGEAEIGAWELATDCSKSPAAQFLNSQVMGSLLPFRRGRIFAAFMRGRRARNLYGGSHDAELLTRRVGEVREELDVDAPVGEVTDADRRAFRRVSIRALIGSWGPLVPILAVVWWVWG
jgi:hypothetical protein